jgi:hypothetical protein
MPISLEAVAANDEAVERLAEACDLNLNVANYPAAGISVDGVAGYQRFARDSTGGAFVRLAGSPRILYASSEGAAGVIAADFDELVRLVVACPYWQSILKYSRNGDLAEMRRAAAALAAYHDGDDDVDEVRAFFKSQFDVTAPADPVGALHRAVSTSDVVVRSPFDVVYITLLGGHTVDQAPILRDFAD